MSLVINGTIISEYTANALTFNGTDITAVFMNGTQVFNHQTFNATWSGSSLYVVTGGTYGFQTSGNLARYYSDGAGGAYIGANTNGSFNTGSSTVTYYGVGSYGYYFTGNSIQTVYGGGFSSSKVYFDIASKFSGSAGGSAGAVLETSGGLLRAGISSGERGPFIQLN